ncbi:hypothetical protein ACROYT_G010178 [Oculina patagonica]
MNNSSHHGERESTIRMNCSGVGKRGPSKCPDGYKLYNNVCYKYFSGPVNWVQASEKCAADFSTLASVNSQAEDLFVRTVLTSGGVSDAWIGVSDLNNHGVMSWLDGSEPLFMNWDYYQKNFPGKKCGVIFTNVNWKYKPCDGARGFICKRSLRGITEYLVLIRYENKLWTDNLYVPGSPRHQALSRHIQEAFLDVYGDYDWFEQVSLDHFSKGKEDKILAHVKLSFTPDDDSPADPIKLLRDSIQGSDSPKRSSITGTLHGEKVELVNATMIVENQTPGSCPSYCLSQQCMPTQCSPWCCDPFGQQFFQNQPQLAQQPGSNLFGGAQPMYNAPNPMPAYSQPNPYPVPQQAQYQYRPQQQPQYPVPARPQPYQYPVPPPPQHYQYPIPPRPQQYQYPPPLPQYPNPTLRLQPYPYTVPAQPQQIRYQVPARPQTLSALQYLLLPRQPQPQHQAPQPYQAIPRPMYPQPWPVYPQPQPMIQQPAPQFLQVNQNTKGNQKPQGSKIEPGQAKSPVQLQGVVFSYPYSAQPYQPVPPPMPVYMPQQYYQPTVQQPKQESHSKKKGKESEKESESGHEKSHEKPPQMAVPQPGYPFMGFPPQPYVPSYPSAVPPAQAAWRVRIYRPVLTIARPPPVFTPGYPVPSVQQPAYQPYPMPAQQYRPLTPPVSQPASPGLLPLGQRTQPQQVSPPPAGYPMQLPLPVSPYRPPYPSFNPYPAGQIPQSPPLPVPKLFQTNTCPAPCPIACAPACTPSCCKDRD